MKRALVVLLTLGLIAGSFAPPATAKKKKRKQPKRIEREVTGAYDLPTPIIVGLCAQTGAVGCVEFATGPGEKYIKELKITDQHGQPVYASIEQDTDGNMSSDHTVGTVCGELTEPLEFRRGSPVIVWISAQPLGIGCVPGEGTSGTVDVTFSNEAPVEFGEIADKKGCKKNKNKGKKKGCTCEAYVPGELGAEAETVVVTDEHTEEAPLEVTIQQGMGLGGPLIGIGGVPVPPDQSSRFFSNLQVDGAAAESGLYIRYEFPVYEDHDLYVNYAEGSEAARVAGFNHAPVAVFDGTGNGGHSEQGAEQLDGLRTADCAGYTLDFSNYLGEGGDYTLTMWLGEIQNDPAPPAE